MKGYNNGIVEHLSERYSSCPASKERDELIKCCNECEKIRTQIDTYISEEYAFAVFREYNSPETQLMELASGKMLSWETVFGTEYKDLDLMKKYELVALAEGKGSYKIK